MIAPWCTCDYEATLKAIRPDGSTIWAGRERLTEGRRLVGRRPHIFVDRTSISLTQIRSLGRFGNQVILPAGDAIWRVARSGDRLFISHTGCASFGISLIREDELILAFGAVTSVPLGRTVTVERGPKGLPATSSYLEDTWLGVSDGDQPTDVRTGEHKRVGRYEVYVERCWDLGTPGTDEQAAIALAGDDLPFATMRSVILLAHCRSKQRDFN